MAKEQALANHKLSDMWSSGVWDSKGLVSQISPESVCFFFFSRATLLLVWDKVWKIFALPCRITYWNINVHLHCWKCLTSSTLLGETALLPSVSFQNYICWANTNPVSVFNSHYCQNLSAKVISKSLKKRISLKLEYKTLHRRRRTRNKHIAWM